AIRDITREREQEKERAHLLELLARTEALAHIGSYEVSLKPYCFTKWSSELFRIHERPIELGPPTPDEYIQRYLSPETAVRLKEWISELIQTGKEGEIEIPITTHLGDRKILRLREVAIFDGATAVKTQGMAQDVTREKMLEKQKEELTAQLIHSQKMEAIGTLTGGIAHEFNNILGGMLGNLQLLEKKFGHEPTVKKYTDRLISLNQRATTIVSQMLGFARKGKYQPQPLSLKMCVSNVLQILAPSTDRRIRFHIESKSNVPLIYADPTQIEQVILNLAKNAVDAIEPLLGKERDTGHITFRLSFEAIAERFGSGLQAEMRNMPMVLLEVRDNGTGIPPELQSRIFEPFFTTKPVGQGTGLGLPMVYGIVENHGGHLFLESEVGKGTSFFLYFPAVCSAMSSTHTNSDELEKKLSLTGAHVLVIDDEAMVRETLAEYLSELGATVEVAESGEKGLERFYALPKENLVVVLDLNLPDISGVQVLEALRAAESRVKVIIGTGYAGNGHAEELQALGAKQILTKPYRLEEVAMQIAELVPLSSRLEGCKPQK
ncbi:MAG: ATP-binding protein, partial [Chloroherpetonaceae bacterium]|nr:ATP-binding protein [Chloroherpetonaceae bacterium]